MSRVTDLKAYLPLLFRDVKEYEELSKAESPILDDIHGKVEKLIDDAFLKTMSVKRLAEWEKQLGVAPNVSSTPENRRSVVLSHYRGLGKLNSALISAIVNAFTGGSCITEFANGTITVKINPPGDTFEDFDTSAIFTELEKRKPAHLALVLELNYSTWEDIKNNFDSWEAVKNGFGNWEDVTNFYAQQKLSLRNR